MDPNLDPPTIDGFCAEWTRLDQSALKPAELRAMFEQYFRRFPWDDLPKDAEGFDLGCGSGRWASLVAPRVRRLHLIDASPSALGVARRNLAGHRNCEFHLSSVDRLPFADGSMDFGYALGVLHHLPDTAAGLRSAVAKLKPGAPFLLYLYYSLDNRSAWHHGLWRVSDIGRRLISRLPEPARFATSQAIASFLYYPLARLALAAERLGLDARSLPLAYYRHRSFYCMRTDALDRFGTRLEKRFSAAEIRAMMEDAGLERIEFSDSEPYWCALGRKQAVPRPSAPERSRILYLVTEDWYFCSHRLALAKAAKERGFDVAVATHVDRHGDAIRREGVELIPIGLRRSGRSPLGEASAVLELAGLYKRLRPHIVHHVAAKPVLYGSLAAKLSGVPVVVNAMAGLGFAFIGNGWKAAALKAFLSRAYRLALSGDDVATVFQNKDDIKLFEDLRILQPGRARLIRGSGVDLERFPAVPEPDARAAEGPVVLLASRLLWDKGVGEFIEAARILRAKAVLARFLLVGDTDPDNPAAIPGTRIARWRDEGIVEWEGWREDMPEVFSRCHVVCLPSHREGLPKVLLEAAASSRPIVATDVPGCREIVRNEENGLLVPARDPQALARGLERLIREPRTRLRFGARGRRIAEEEFSVERVVDQTLSLYQELLSKARGPA